MIKEESINKIKVKPLIISKTDTSTIKGSELFPSLFYNLFVCSKKRSGKTSLINTIIQKCTDKRTIFFIFCPTVKVDQSWIEIVNELSMGAEEPEEDKKEEVVGKKLKFDDLTKKKKEYKPKKISPEVSFIFDDASDMLRNPAVATLLKKNRHLKANVIISSQYIHDLRPESIKQIDYFLAFKSFSEDKMALVHKGLDLSLDFDKLWNLYQHCTNKPYSFLYINVRTEQYRCNFNKSLDIEF
jgi:hypothetical protein